MPVAYLQASESVRQQAISGLRITSQGDEADLILRERPLDEVQDEMLEMPHQVFTMDPSDIRDATNLDAADAAGWRYFIKQEADSTKSSAIEVGTGANGPQFSHRQKGRMTLLTREMMSSLETSPATKGASFIVSLLRIPAVARTDALWLKPQSTGDQIIIPIACASPKLVTGKHYSVPDFLEVVRSINGDQEERRAEEV